MSYSIYNVEPHPIEESTYTSSKFAYAQSNEDNDNKESNIIENIEDKDVDEFGIVKIYPTKPGGEEWHMDMANPLGDKRFDPFNRVVNETTEPIYTLTKNEDLSWKLRPTTDETKVRIHAFTSTGYNQSKIATYNHADLENIGYMQSPNDWKNVEMTGYVRLNDYNNESAFVWFTRGGIHYMPTSPNSQPCEGSGYKGNLYFSGSERFAKEQWHVKYEHTEFEEATEPLKDRWIGYKFIEYNINSTGNNEENNIPERAVKMESWINENNDGKSWVKVDEYIDDGGLGTEGGECGGTEDQIISWGGPVATFRWDEATDVDFKNLSVREIDAVEDIAENTH
jgi:hypothetical protein